MDKKNTTFNEAPSLKLVTQKLNGYNPILNKNKTINKIKTKNI